MLMEGQRQRLCTPLPTMDEGDVEGDDDLRGVELFELLLLDFQRGPSSQALVTRLQDGLDALRAARTKIDEHESRDRPL